MIFVMGASGRMGGAVISHLSEPCRAGVRGGSPIESAAETVPFDLDDPRTHRPALSGCEAMFVMRPPTATRREPFERLMQAAKDAGVAFVVCASVYGAGRSRLLPHRHMEAAVRESGLSYVFLRPADFMQNLADVHGEAIRRSGQISVPAGKGRSALLDVEDVGRAATAALAAKNVHAGRTYDLTGPEALTFKDVARTMTRVLGRTIRYRPVSVPRFILRQVRAGRPLPMALAMAALYTAQRLGRAAPASADFDRLTGRSATSLANYVSRERTRFMPTDRTG